MQRTRRQADTRILLPVAALALSGIAAPLPAAAPTSSAPAITTTDGGFLVSVALTARLATMHPDIAKGVWMCSARVMVKRLIDAKIAKISGLSGEAAHDEFHSALEYRAHYLGQQATSEFPIADGAYTGTLSLRIKVASEDLVDPATHRLIEDPGVMVGCWLQLLTTAGRGNFAYQAGAAPARTDSVEAMRRVRAPPYFLQSATLQGE